MSPNEQDVLLGMSALSLNTSEKKKNVEEERKGSRASEDEKLLLWAYTSFQESLLLHDEHQKSQIPCFNHMFS